MNDRPAPLFTGPATKSSTITLDNRDEIVGLHPNKTLTVKLPALNRDGYEWRLGEIPDPTVLKRVSNYSQEYTPNEDPKKPGEQTIVFEGVGVGDVDVKLWYGTLWASPMDATQSFQFIASVTPEEVKAKTKKSKKHSRKT